MITYLNIQRADNGYIVTWDSSTRVFTDTSDMLQFVTFLLGGSAQEAK